MSTDVHISIVHAMARRDTERLFSSLVLVALLLFAAAVAVAIIEMTG